MKLHHPWRITFIFLLFLVSMVAVLYFTKKPVVQVPEIPLNPRPVVSLTNSAHKWTVPAGSYLTLFSSLPLQDNQIDYVQILQWVPKQKNMMAQVPERTLLICQSAHCQYTINPVSAGSVELQVVVHDNKGNIFKSELMTLTGISSALDQNFPETYLSSNSFETLVTMTGNVPQIELKAFATDTESGIKSIRIVRIDNENISEPAKDCHGQKTCSLTISPAFGNGELGRYLYYDVQTTDMDNNVGYLYAPNRTGVNVKDGMYNR